MIDLNLSGDGATKDEAAARRCNSPISGCSIPPSVLVYV